MVTILVLFTNDGLVANHNLTVPPRTMDIGTNQPQPTSGCCTRYDPGNVWIFTLPQRTVVVDLYPLHREYLYHHADLAPIPTDISSIDLRVSTIIMGHSYLPEAS